MQWRMCTGVVVQAMMDASLWDSLVLGKRLVRSVQKKAALKFGHAVMMRAMESGRGACAAVSVLDASLWGSPTFVQAVCVV